ncbi:MAG: SHOCT domain-containing protein [Anaerolineales bacterium]
MITIVLIILAGIWARRERGVLRIIGLILISYYGAVFLLLIFSLLLETLTITVDWGANGQAITLLALTILVFFFLYKYYRPHRKISNQKDIVDDSSSSLADELKKLSDLRAAEKISEEEFSKAKSKLLDHPS